MAALRSLGFAKNYCPSILSRMMSSGAGSGAGKVFSFKSKKHCFVIFSFKNWVGQLAGNKKYQIFEKKLFSGRPQHQPWGWAWPEQAQTMFGLFHKIEQFRTYDFEIIVFTETPNKPNMFGFVRAMSRVFHSTHKKLKK